MNKQSGPQYNVPGQPDAGKPDPNLPTEDEKNAILKGAKNEDQLDQLRPQGDDDKADGKVGAPPVSHVNQGNKDSDS